MVLLYTPALHCQVLDNRTSMVINKAIINVLRLESHYSINAGNYRNPADDVARGQNWLLESKEISQGSRETLIVVRMVEANVDN